MALAAVQTALARLCTEAAARAELRADPEAFARRWGLSSEESESLAREVLGEAEAFARSLRRKRMDEAARSMPLARQVLGLSFEPFFARFAAATPLGSTRNPALDALDFHHWLLTSGVTALALDDRHALRYEAAWLTMQHTARRFLALWLLVPNSGSPSRTFAIWWRWRGKLRHWVGG
jgi:hypothetical protein